MTTVFSICSDCERQALRHPKRGQALAESLICLTQLLLKRKRLKGLHVVHESCLRNCPLGKICVSLTQGNREIRHHLSPGEDLRAVAARLAGTARG